MVCICRLHQLQELITIFDIAKTLSQLIQTQTSISIFIQSLEDFLKVSDFIRIRLNCYGCQSCLLELLMVLEFLQGVNINLCELLSLAILCKSLDPRVLKSFLGGKSPLRLSDLFLDQIFGFVGHIIPLLSVKIEFSLLDHSQNLLVIITIKGWVPTQQDIHDTPSRPHIARHIIVACQDFRRDVIWLY